MDTAADIYGRARPFVDEAIERFAGGGELTDAALDSMVRHIIARADLRGRPVAGGSERLLGDVIKGLLLSRLVFGEGGRPDGYNCGDYYDCYDSYYDPYYYPYYSYYPYFRSGFGWGGFGRGGFGHGRTGGFGRRGGGFNFGGGRRTGGGFGRGHNFRGGRGRGGRR